MLTQLINKRLGFLLNSWRGIIYKRFFKDLEGAITHNISHTWPTYQWDIKWKVNLKLQINITKQCGEGGSNTRPRSHRWSARRPKIPLQMVVVKTQDRIDWTTDAIVHCSIHGDVTFSYSRCFQWRWMFLVVLMSWLALNIVLL
jgi:hypothetical protein